MPERIIRYRERARHLREMAINIPDIAAKKALAHLAGEYEEMAVQVEQILADRAKNGCGKGGADSAA